MKIISSSSRLLQINQHFKIFAGPGSGKTYWMVGHIKDVLHRSEKLSKTRKVACITYTNIAVETVLSRLGSAAERVEVSTIHSFLYQNIVKPYISFIKLEYNINVQEIDGHQDPYVNFSYVSDWIKNHPEKKKLVNPFSVNQLTKRPENIQALKRWLESICYSFDTSNDLKIKCNNSEAYYLTSNSRRFLRSKCLEILSTDFWDYKKSYWEKGILFHDDILFFSYQLIQKYPFILKLLSAKYPYIFIDEFQDTNPIQSAILNNIGSAGSFVGVIGDQLQSIYGFQGADSNGFMSFTLPEMECFIINENRRSSQEIIQTLNSIRFDVQQVPYECENGSQPIIIVGEMAQCLSVAREHCENKNIHSLSRDNITSNAMKRGVSEAELNRKLIDELNEVDQNNFRRKFIGALVTSVELARQLKYKEAVNSLEKVLGKDKDKVERKKDAINYIRAMLTKFDEFREGTLYDFYLLAKNELKIKLSNFKAGKPKDFYQDHTYQELALCVKIVEDISFHKTIHKAKGDEFDHVLLILKKEKDLDFLLNPNLAEDEEHRVNYVAISRAKKTLFISVPKLAKKNENSLKHRFKIQRL